MGLSAEESKYILEQMFENDLDRKKTDNLVNDVRAKRWVRLNAVAYLTDKLNLKIASADASSDDDDEDDGPRSKKGKQKRPVASTNQNFGHYMALLKSRRDSVLPVSFHFRTA